MNWHELKLGSQTIYRGELAPNSGSVEFRAIWAQFLNAVVPISRPEALTTIRIEFWGDSGNFVMYPYGDRNGNVPPAVLEVHSSVYRHFASERIHSDQDIDDVTAEINEFEHNLWLRMVDAAKEISISTRLGREAVTITRSMPQDEEIFEQVRL